MMQITTWQDAIDQITSTTAQLSNLVEAETEQQGHTPKTHIVNALHILAHAVDYAGEGMTNDRGFSLMMTAARDHLEQARKLVAAG